MKIKVLCEGETEEGLKPLLDRAINNSINNSKCGVKIKSYQGVSDLRRNLGKRVRVEIENGASVVYCLVDCYHYPDVSETLSLQDRVVAIKKDLSDRIDEGNRSHVKIVVVIQEVETWILADEEVLVRKFKRDYRLQNFHNLESDGNLRHPAQVLKDIFRKHHPLKKAYSKVNDGVTFLREVDWQKVYSKCAVFKQLIDDLRADCDALS